MNRQNRQHIEMIEITNYKIDFYYGKEAEQFSFYRIPKLLFTDSRFSKVSIEARVLYGLLLDRMSLYIKNGGLTKKTVYKEETSGK